MIGTSPGQEVFYRSSTTVIHFRYICIGRIIGLCIRDHGLDDRTVKWTGIGDSYTVMEVPSAQCS